MNNYEIALKSQGTRKLVKWIRAYNEKSIVDWMAFFCLQHYVESGPVLLDDQTITTFEQGLDVILDNSEDELNPVTGNIDQWKKESSYKPKILSLSNAS